MIVMDTLKPWTNNTVCFVRFNFFVLSESTLDLEIKATQKSDLLFSFYLQLIVFDFDEKFASNVIFCVVDKYCVLNTSNDTVYYM